MPIPEPGVLKTPDLTIIRPRLTTGRIPGILVILGRIRVGTSWGGEFITGSRIPFRFRIFNLRFLYFVRPGIAILNKRAFPAVGSLFVIHKIQFFDTLDPQNLYTVSPPVQHQEAAAFPLI